MIGDTIFGCITDRENTETSVHGGDYQFVAEHDDAGEVETFDTFDELFAAELADEEWTVHQYAV